MRSIGEKIWPRVRAGGVNAWASTRLGVASFWAHRTKNLGGIGLAAGAAEHWLDVHQKLPLWLMHERGMLLMFFGCLVGVIGFYNTIARWFGWP